MSRSLTLVAFTLLVACSSPPEWYLRSRASLEMEEMNENLRAVRAAVETSREMHPATDSGRTGEEPAGAARPWYRVGPALGQALQPATFPQPKIVELPPRRARRDSGRPGFQPPDYPVPPYTLVVPSPHPGVRCAPDLLGGQRCQAQP